MSGALPLPLFYAFMSWTGVEYLCHPLRGNIVRQLLQLQGILRKLSDLYKITGRLQSILRIDSCVCISLTSNSDVINPFLPSVPSHM